MRAGGAPDPVALVNAGPWAAASGAVARDGRLRFCAWRSCYALLAYYTTNRRLTIVPVSRSWIYFPLSPPSKAMAVPTVRFASCGAVSRMVRAPLPEIRFSLTASVQTLTSPEL